MHEQHPDYFKQHRKSFRYVVSEKEPQLGLDFPSESNYAFGVHSSTSDHLCDFEKHPHYHVLYECETDKKRGFNIPCLLDRLSFASGLLGSSCPRRYYEAFAESDAV